MISLHAMALGTAAAFGLAVAAGGAACAQTFHDRDGAIHFMYTPNYAKKIGRGPNRETGEMEYFGGRVFARVNVVSVIWGSNVNSQLVQGLPGFLTALPNSTFQDQLTQYSTKGLTGVNGHKGSNQTIKRGTFYGQVVITPHNTNTSLSNKAVWMELEYQIGQGNLPAQAPNILYMLYFPTNVTITAFGLTSCSDFGAYHFASSKHKSSTNIFYGVMPDCGYTFQEHTIISSHEFAEATTDNIPTPGTNPNYPQAWNNSAGAEIGDLCENTEGNLTVAGHFPYSVQQVYLNSTGNCSTGNYTSP